MMRHVFSTALDPILSTNSLETYKKVILFPNPTSQILNIGGIVDSGGVEIELYDAFGRFIVKSTNTQIDLSEYQSGIYFVRIPSISDKTYKVIKQ